MPESTTDDAGPDETDVWTIGSYDQIAPNFYELAGELVERAAVDADDRVLDVGCGTGSVAITAARRGAATTGVDVTPDLLETARRNAEVAGLEEIEWREGDATDLPFEGDAFDATLSSLGHIYGTPAATAARELLRVTRQGGRIGFTSWTPASLFAQLGAVVLQYVPPADLPVDPEEPPFLWGDEHVVRDRLGEGTDELTVRTGTVAYPALSPAHFLREQETHSGTFRVVRESVGDDDLRDLREEMVETVEPHFDPDRNVVELEYLLATGTVR